MEESSMSEAPRLLSTLSRIEARKLPAGAVVELGSGELTQDARSVIEARRISVLRYGRVIVQYGEYLPAASEAVPQESDTVACPACSERILASARKCKHCGEWVAPAVPANVRGPSSTSTVSRFGIGVGVVGGILLLFALVMDTTVATSSGRRVHNIGLLNQQQSLLMIGGIVPRQYRVRP
jgi:hypothetical protein